VKRFFTKTARAGGLLSPFGKAQFVDVNDKPAWRRPAEHERAQSA